MFYLKKSFSVFAALAVFGLLFGPAAARPKPAPALAAGPAPFDPANTLHQLGIRNIGPANMGGRVVDFAAPEGSSTTLYAAVGPSGLWKTEDAGITWAPSFHREATVSVGAVAVSPSHPDIVWVGTGEATARNSVAPGDGVYKSEDAGRTWKNMGLADTRFISRISIDPVDPDVVFVAAQGDLWGPTEARGVYRTKDGGRTWAKVLSVNPDTGACDMAMDPSNSKILYAGMWDHRRIPYHFRSGGPGSAVFKTTDGGDTWFTIHQGLPAGPYGRIGLGVARSKPNVVYALVEAGDSGLFRSDDKGATWVRTCDEATYDRVNFRPFYYSRLTVDPNNDLVVYVYSGSAYVSRDAGRTFENVFRGGPHADHHAIWVDPRNSDHVVDGNDGGIDISWDGGRRSAGVASQAWAEVYNVGYDMREPYWVNVGLQDNGNWHGPSNVRERSISNSHWFGTGGGDGYYGQIDPVEWWVLYRNLQMGGIERHNLKTGESQRIRPEPPLAEPPYRFNWNSPIHLSIHDRNVLYFGGNYLFKSTDRGMSWIKASPDLTTNNPAKIIDSGGLTPDNTGAENHCTILTISESPLKAGLIWVGTDDGQVQFTRDGGAQWTNVTANVKGWGADDNWITRIEASHFLEGRVYMTVSRHQVADHRPYVFRSDDFGKTWVSIRGDLPSYGYLHTIREDPENRNLLFVGSEFGLFISFDGGAKWLPYKGGFPTVAVRDIKIHPRDRDLIVGTHGRGVWIIDDIRPWEQLTAEKAKAGALLFDVKPALLFAPRGVAEGTGEFMGQNSPYGAAISYYLNPAVAKEARIRLSIVDASGRDVAVPFASKEAGINRVYWNLREGAGGPPAAAAGGMGGGQQGGFGGGAWALPGQYKAVLEVNGKTYETPVIIKEDELQGISMDDRRLAQRYAREAQDLAQKGRGLLQSLETSGKAVDDLAAAVGGMKADDEAVRSKISAVKGRIEAVKSVYFVSPPGFAGYRKPILVAFRGGTAAELVQGIARSFGGMGAPTRTAIDQLNDLKAFLDPLLAEMREIKEKDIPALNKLLAEKGIPYIR
ncbi:MAG: hypothetical protein FJY82_06125 [Candidatus Aminicenantes bacterium]|nr:hypothetical protein [Candidatus Aminicenantes bacterium]